jgi:hypothetical protein
MNLPPDLLRKLETKEGLESVMAQAAVITAGGDAVAAKTAPKQVTVTAAAQGTCTASQPPIRQKNKERKENLPTHQPGEYEQNVMEKR